MQIPAWMRWYKKPEYRDIKAYSTSVSTGRRPLSPDGRGKTSIPSKLKLERILENKTCSPMSLYDFYMYLKYIEFSSENLEFYLWFKNYEKTWAKSGGSKELAEDSTHELRAMASDSTLGKSSLAEPAKLEAGREILSKISQLIASPKACKPCRTTSCPRPSSDTTSLISSSPAGTRSSEVQAIVSTYILPGSPKELNIPPSMRDSCLAALAQSPDPAALRPLAEHAYQLLRNCSHRNFVRLGVGNGTFETVCVATTLGFVLCLAGMLAVLLRAFAAGGIGSTSRWEVWAAWPMWWVGCSLVLSGLRGSCFFLLLFSRRQPLPWERFDDAGSVRSAGSGDGGLLSKVGRLMIFDRKLRVSDVDLRRLQRKIVVQSLVGGAVFAFLAVGVFIFLPIWRETAGL